MLAPLCASAAGLPLTVSVDSADQRAVACAFSGDRLFAVWQDERDGGNLYGQAYAPDGAPLWEESGRAIVSAAQNQGFPAIAADGEGGFYLVWMDARNLQKDLYAQRFDSEGAPLWEELPVAQHADGKDDHRIAADRGGGVYIVWEDWRNGHLDIYAQRVSADGRALWEANGAVVCGIPQNQYDPLVSADENGCFVLWWHVPELDIWQAYAQRMSPDGKPLWGEKGAAVSLNPASQSLGAAVADGSGGAYAFWVDHRNDVDLNMNVDLYAQRFDSSGRRLWGDDGKAVCLADGAQIEPAALPDGEGGAYLVWTDQRDRYDDIYGQRVLADGSFAWGEGGSPICAGPGRQRAPRLARFSDGVWIAWYDYRRDLEEQSLQDVYAQRALSDGTLVWGIGGLPIAERPGFRLDLNVCAGGQGAAAFWAEQASAFSSPDIYGWFSAGLLSDALNKNDALEMEE